MYMMYDYIDRLICEHGKVDEARLKKYCDELVEEVKKRNLRVILYEGRTLNGGGAHDKAREDI